MLFVKISFMNIPNWEAEKKIFAEKGEFIIGVDEAGRGPLAGPVVAGAVVLRNEKLLNFKGDEKMKETEFKNLIAGCYLIRDSKTLSEKQRERVYNFIKENFYVGVGVCDEKTIDRINILEASFLAMKMAITDLKRKLRGKEGIILLDGNCPISNFSADQTAIPQGDGKIKSIAAASIVAKVTRDRMMRELARKYPQYLFEKHKGYGTKQHLEALRKFGPCPIHRKSFSPIENLLGNR